MKHTIINNITDALLLLEEMDFNFKKNILNNSYIFTYSKTNDLIISSYNYWDISIDCFNYDKHGYIIIESYLNFQINHASKVNDVDFIRYVSKVQEIRHLIDKNKLYEKSFIIACWYNSFDVINLYLNEFNIEITKNIKNHLIRNSYTEGSKYVQKILEKKLPI